MGGFRRLTDMSRTSEIPTAFNALSKHVEELTVKAEELGGFESLARIAKVEVDLAALHEDFVELGERTGRIASRLVAVEKQLGDRAEATLLRRLWRLALVWLGMQLLYTLARVALALKGHG